jgi:cellulose synthase/poly-beta-1,6-N-acetylglucosamine synthase-like glycosyltransferase
VTIFHPALSVSPEADFWGRIFLYSYFVLLAVLSGFGFHRYLMVYLFYRHAKNAPKPKKKWEQYPRVTVQLPVFNELYVAERLIDAVCKLRYPREKFEVQILDDSTDDTQEVCKKKVEEWKAQGIDIVYLHRTDRTGYKAGALDAGQKVCKGDYIAIFDADFVPKEDFLERTIHFFTDPDVGCVQTRWGHLNREYSLLTYMQSVFLDGHFIMEHAARNRSGRFFNFSGTAGLWRKTAIEEAGGWEHDTLTEDLDISYRAQLEKWKFVFVPEIETPAELPVDMNGFKSQQHRWVKGSMQTSKKLLGKVIKADLPLHVKTEGVVHLTGNLCYLMMALLAFLIFPVTYFRPMLSMQHSVVIDLVIFALATISVCVYYLLAQREIYGFKDVIKAFLHIPFLLAVGIGMCVSNSRAVIEGLFSRKSGEFVRTPKYAIESADQTFVKKSYRAKLSLRFLTALFELLLGLGFLGVIVYSIRHGMYGAVPFQALFCVGFLYVAFLSLFQGKLTSR